MNRIDKHVLVSRVLIGLSLVAVLWGFGNFSVRAASAADPAPTVFVVPVSGTVDPAMAAFMKRVQREISEKQYAKVVFEIDTFGGRVDSALEIVDTLLKIPSEQSVAFVTEKAISAGALISLACGELAMTPGTTLGDTAPIIQSQEGPKMMGEKFQSPLRAKFRALAERNGYPAALAETMVTPAKVVYAVGMEDGTTTYMDARAFAELDAAEKDRVTRKKTVVEKGELLTMHDAEARQYGFSRISASDIDTVLADMGVDHYTIERIAPNWSEIMVRFIGGIAPILMMIGLAALYIEIKAPGFGVPGLVGIICLAVVFLNQYFVGLANYTEFLIILLGLVLMGVEVFVLPGFGIAGFAGIICVAVGMILALQDFVLPDPEYPWQMSILIGNIIRVVGSFLVAFVIGLLSIRYVLPRFSSATEGPYLQASLAGAHADSEETKRVAVGDTGEAMTYLRPSGKAEINDDIFDVITENEYVEKNTPVVVTKIRGNTIVVDRKDSA